MAFKDTMTPNKIIRNGMASFYLNIYHWPSADNWQYNVACETSPAIYFVNMHACVRACVCERARALLQLLLWYIGRFTRVVRTFCVSPSGIISTGSGCLVGAPYRHLTEGVIVRLWISVIDSGFCEEIPILDHTRTHVTIIRYELSINVLLWSSRITYCDRTIIPPYITRLISRISIVIVVPHSGQSWSSLIRSRFALRE